MTFSASFPNHRKSLQSSWQGSILCRLCPFDLTGTEVEACREGTPTSSDTTVSAGLTGLDNTSLSARGSRAEPRLPTSSTLAFTSPPKSCLVPWVDCDLALGQGPMTSPMGSADLGSLAVGQCRPLVSRAIPSTKTEHSRSSLRRSSSGRWGCATLVQCGGKAKCWQGYGFSCCSAATTACLLQGCGRQGGWTRVMQGEKSSQRRSHMHRGAGKQGVSQNHAESTSSPFDSPFATCRA